jgi:hypothetical protein
MFPSKGREILKMAANKKAGNGKLHTCQSISIAKIKMSKLFKLVLTLFYLSYTVVARHITDATSNEWKQVSSSVSFQRTKTETKGAESNVLKHAEQEAIYRMLLSSNEADPSYTYQPLDSSTEYNEYQLAWHLLGYYVDCNSAQSYCSRYAMYAVVSRSKLLRLQALPLWLYFFLVSF